MLATWPRVGRDRLGDGNERDRRALQSALGGIGLWALRVLTTGQLFMEEYYGQTLVARVGIGTNHLDGNTRLCTATADTALKESFGTEGSPGSYEDVDVTDTLLLVGHNVAETQTVLWMRMLDRLHGPNRPKLVCVDPRPTNGSARAWPPLVAQRARGHGRSRAATGPAALTAASCVWSNAIEKICGVPASSLRWCLRGVRPTGWRGVGWG